MRSEIFLLAASVGAVIWALRVLPLRIDISRLPQKGPLTGFMSATGSAAIAALFAAEMLPQLRGDAPTLAVIGSCAVAGVFAVSRSVIAATMAGAIAYGLAFSVFT